MYRYVYVLIHMVKSMKEQQHYDASSPSDKEPERRQTSGSKYPALPTQALRLWSKMMAQYKKFIEIQVMWWTQEYIVFKTTINGAYQLFQMFQTIAVSGLGKLTTKRLVIVGYKCTC